MAGLIDLNGLGHFKAKENAMVADTYSASKTYAVGDYVYYNGTLYRCTTAISTTEAWTAGHWTAVKLADDCSALKTALTLVEDAVDLEPQPIGSQISFSVSGRAVRYTDGVLTNTSAYNSTNYIDISDYQKIIYPRIKTTANPTSKPGIAFYDENQSFITNSGIAGIYSSDEVTMVYEETVIPQNAKYIRLCIPVALNTVPYYLKDPNNVKMEVEAKVDELDADITNLSNFLQVSAMPIGWTLGRSINSSGEITTTSSAAVSHYEPITTPFYRGGSLVDGNNNNLYVYVCQWNNGTWIERTAFNVLDEAFNFNENCTHYRIVIGYPSSSGLEMTQEVIDTYFKPYTFFPMQDVVDDVDMLKAYHADYSGKKLSILGDSISTFVPSADKVDGKAPTGCTTNYPGNPVQYENSSVTSVDLTWWGKVLSQFDMVLGINESWAGSTIGYNSNYTDSGKYTADNCMCSETRIGHLDENGTPDLIIVFGGTNDINHHLDGNNTRFAVGSLDTANNPYDFDNFPMVTDTYYGAITTMLLRIQHEYPTATILMLLPYFCTYTHTSSGDIASPSDQNIWCNAAIDVCKFLGVEYLDLRTIINMYDVSTLLFDNLHPNANGMAAIAKAVIHKLNSML